MGTFPMLQPAHASVSCSCRWLLACRIHELVGSSTYAKEMLVHSILPALLSQRQAIHDQEILFHKLALNHLCMLQWGVKQMQWHSQKKPRSLMDCCTQWHQMEAMWQVKVLSKLALNLHLTMYMPIQVQAAAKINNWLVLE